MATDTLAPAAAIAAPRIKSELMQQRVRAARLFLVPMLVALAIVAGWPLLRSIYFSFTDASLNNLDAAEWYGLGNYLRWTVLESGTIRPRLITPVTTSGECSPQSPSLSGGAISAAESAALAIITSPLKGKF